MQVAYVPATSDTTAKIFRSRASVELPIDGVGYLKQPEPNHSTSFGLKVTLPLIALGTYLAAVSGPIFTPGVVDSHRSATAGAMGQLKMALGNFNKDLGQFPITGEKVTEESINAAADSMLGETASGNILVSADAYRRALSNRPMGIEPLEFAQRWKGPYMDSDPREFMLDSWNNRIRYLCRDHTIWLHSAGPDGVYDPPEISTAREYQGDDLTVMVSKVDY